MSEVLTFLTSRRNLRRFDGVGWFFMAALIVLITLLPLGGDPRDRYPWGFSSIAWTLAAASIYAGVRTLNREQGVTFDRAQGVAVFWTITFGRRRERRVPLGLFDRLHVRTWVQSHRGGRDVRYYVLALLGPKNRESLIGYNEANRPAGIRQAGDYLKLRLQVEDETPRREPASEL